MVLVSEVDGGTATKECGTILPLGAGKVKPHSERPKGCLPVPIQGAEIVRSSLGAVIQPRRKV